MSNEPFTAIARTSNFRDIDIQISEKFNSFKRTQVIIILSVAILRKFPIN